MTLEPIFSRLSSCLGQPGSPTTHTPSLVGGGGGGGADHFRGDVQTGALTPQSKAGQRKKRQRSHGDARQSTAAVPPAVVAPTPIALVPVHTLEKTPPYLIGSSSTLPTVTGETAASSCDLTRAVSANSVVNTNSADRPRTSTGCERGSRSAMPGAKGVHSRGKREVRLLLSIQPCVFLCRNGCAFCS